MKTTATVEFQRLIGRAMVDPAFRAELIANPAATAAQAGITLAPEELAKLDTIDQYASERIAQRNDETQFWS
jgi:hypothetical protein